MSEKSSRVSYHHVCWLNKGAFPCQATYNVTWIITTPICYIRSFSSENYSASSTVISSERLLMVQHLFSKQKGWKYGKANSESSAEMLQMDQKPKVSHYCLESESGTVFLTFVPLPQFLNSCSITIFLMLFPLFNCYFKFYRWRNKNWNAFELLCGQDLQWGQVSWLRQWW